MYNFTRTPDIQSHLKNVYSVVSMAAFAAAAGAYLHCSRMFMGGFLSAILGFGCIIGLMAVPDNNGKNRKIRLSLLLGFAGNAGGLPSVIPRLDLSIHIIGVKLSVNTIKFC